MSDRSNTTPKQQGCAEHQTTLAAHASGSMGGLVAHGIVNNKPAEVVYSASERGAKGGLSDAVAVLRTGEPVLLDMSNGQFLTLLEMWRNG